MNAFAGADVIGSYINALTWAQTLEILGQWARQRENRYVCVCNVHSVVTACQDPDFKEVLQLADMNTPDGAPIAWMLRTHGFDHQQRINGPDLVWRLCEKAQTEGLVVCFYGSSEDTLRRLRIKLEEAFPRLRLTAMISPPFRALTDEEDAEYVQRIAETRAHIVFVGLGCPKQEKWMAAHRRDIDAVMIGVGAAFEFHAGVVSRAPKLMQDYGLEWLHRLSSEPKRLWKRYLFTNSFFLVSAVRQIAEHHLKRRAGE